MRITSEDLPIASQLLQLDISKAKNFDVDQALNEDLIDINIPVDKPPACLVLRQNFKDIPLCSLGEVSTIGGQAKSRKTLLSSIFTAAALRNEDVCGIVWGELPEEKRGVLYFDTEQGDYHAQKAVLRTLQLAGNLIPPKEQFKPYRLRRRNVEERTKEVEKAIKKMPNLGFVLIDGIRDLVNDVNDAKECNDLITKLMDLSGSLFCHIMVVIHENPGSGKIRGHLGTELMGKSETVFKVEKIKNDESASLVTASYTRNMPFEPFAIGFNDDNLPTIIQDYEVSPKASGKGKAKNKTDFKKRLNEYTDSEHIDFLSRIFNGPGVSKLRFSDIQDGVLTVYGDNFYRQDANACCQFFLDDGLLEKVQEPGKGKAGIYYQLTDKVKAEKSPF